MSSRVDFYQAHLDRVSRSFAFCIRQLPEPLRGWISLSYLLCRVLDTIEDSPWSTKELQSSQFQRFDEAVRDKNKLYLLENWLSDFPAQINIHEKQLLTDARSLVDDLHLLPAAIRDLISQAVQTMSGGMQHFAERTEGGHLRLHTLKDVNQYCFFVAGLVGEMLAQLFAKFEPLFPLNQKTILQAHHFGLFLQKVNLLKDQIVDEKEGRHLIPSREIVEHSAEANVREAYAFLQALPLQQVEFRRFCAWSLFLGLEAIHAARSSLAAGAVLKVSRDHLSQVLVSVDMALSNESELQNLFSAALAKLSWSRLGSGTVDGEAQIPDWILNLYLGALREPDLLALGL